MIKDDLFSAAKAVDLGTTNIKITPRRIVLHYSGGSTLSSAIDTLRKRGLSYHVLIDTDGKAHQARPFTRKTLHAGRSNWKQESGLENTDSVSDDAIGISLINRTTHRNSDIEANLRWLANDCTHFVLSRLRERKGTRRSSRWGR